MKKPHHANYFKIALLLLTIVMTIPFISFAQQKIKGVVTDAITHEPLPFATVRTGAGNQGFVTSLDGRFEAELADSIHYFEISYLGYVTKRINLPLTDVAHAFELSPVGKSLNEVVIKPPYEKIRRILNKAIANRDQNNPDKYDAYRCRIYYKMTADMKPEAGMSRMIENDTSKDGESIRRFLEDQHLLMTETYSIRTWERPQKLQEEVVGSRISGFKKNMFTNIITDALPFHSYYDFLTLNGKDYHNPVAKGYGLRYNFNLDDELLQGNDTLWILSFRPKRGINGLKGQVYISSKQYAIANLVATTYDESLKRTVRVEQQYRFTGDRWFPHQLNYICDWEQKQDSLRYHLVMKGNSDIDSVTYLRPKGFHFDKMHTVKLLNNADELHDSTWNKLRPIALDDKEQRTYQFMDSLLATVNADKFLPFIDKLLDAKIPISFLDLNLKRLYTKNPYEKNRFGLGLQTNEKICKWASLGGWFGYGTRDAQWKYGGFLEFYGNKYKELTFKLAYDNDLRDPGRVQINPELDRNYLRSWYMSRVDKVETFSATLKKKFNYFTVEASGRYERFTPMYEYSFAPEQVPSMQEFTAREANLNIRYAYAEHSSPMLGHYVSTGTKFPILYGRLTYGNIESGNWHTPYKQALAAVSWRKHLNRIGLEQFLVFGGKSWSDEPLPLSKLFAGNGMQINTNTLYAFGGMATMHPYDYYTDQFVNFYWSHSFDWRLYKLYDPNVSVSSVPYLSICHNILYGTLTKPQVHEGVKFAVPDNAYHETGVVLNSLVRLNYLNVYYLTLNAGYFYHWAGNSFNDKNGTFVYGLGIEF